MTLLYYALCDLDTWLYAGEMFVILGVAYLVARSR
jgi:hypothetical protein